MIKLIRKSRVKLRQSERCEWQINRHTNANYPVGIKTHVLHPTVGTESAFYYLGPRLILVCYSHDAEGTSWPGIVAELSMDMLVGYQSAPAPASPDSVVSSMLTVVGLLACLAAQFPLGCLPALDT